MADSQMSQLLTDMKGTAHGTPLEFWHDQPYSRQTSPYGKLFSSIKGYENMGRLDALKQVAQHEVKTIDRIGMKTVILRKRSI